MRLDTALNYSRSRLSKFSRILNDDGFMAMVASIAREPINRWHRYRRLKAGHVLDMSLCIDTEYDRVEDNDFPALVPETQEGYDPVGVDTFQQILDLLPIRSEEFSFVDLGSGKGRALIMASALPFRRIVGVEYSPHYYEVACRNIASLQRSTTATPIELIQGDATEFQPPDGKSIIFLFNPFQGPAFSKVVANLEEALSGPANEIYVAYVNPVCRKELDGSRSFRVICDRKSRDPYRAFVIYHARSVAEV